MGTWRGQRSGDPRGPVQFRVFTGVPWTPNCVGCSGDPEHSCHLAHLLSFGAGVTFEARETWGTLWGFAGRHVSCGEQKVGDPTPGSCGDRRPHSPLVLVAQPGPWSLVCLVLPARVTGQGESHCSETSVTSGSARPGDPRHVPVPSRGDNRILTPPLP